MSRRSGSLGEIVEASKGHLVFTRRLSRCGTHMQSVLTIPQSVKGCLELDKLYKIEITEVDVSKLRSDL